MYRRFFLIDPIVSTLQLGDAAVEQVEGIPSKSNPPPPPPPPLPPVTTRTTRPHDTRVYRVVTCRWGSQSPIRKGRILKLIRIEPRISRTQSALLKTFYDVVKELHGKHQFTNVVDLSPFADGRRQLPSGCTQEQWLYVIKDTTWKHLHEDVKTNMNGVLLILSPPLLKKQLTTDGPNPPAFVTVFKNGKLQQQEWCNWEVAHTFEPKTQTSESKARVYYRRRHLGFSEIDAEHHNNATDDMLCAYIATYLGVHLVTRDRDLHENVEKYAKDDGPLFDLLVNAHCHVLTCTKSQPNTNTLFHYITTFIPNPPASMSEFPFVNQEDNPIPIEDPIDLIVENNPEEN